ncbi:uncharacterized protein LOC124266682 [Haliotis rubra]|uniref:uncharacterized protein LOC124266682 n=1 Tax=Haliotis rubra TaxID=36100 RepID=UPI001EE62B54|nr:uncharacterized protein LOC124266682 [Haliotis rubra]
MKRCPRKKTSYKLIFKTGSSSRADLTVGITGRCGRVSVALKNGIDITLRKRRRSTFTFVDDSVCGLKDIGLAFSYRCHRDDWFVAYVVVEYEEIATGNMDRVKFETNCWLSAKTEHGPTTGIECHNMPPLFTMLVDLPGYTKCQPSHKCEH